MARTSPTCFSIVSIGLTKVFLKFIPIFVQSYARILLLSQQCEHRCLKSIFILDAHAKNHSINVGKLINLGPLGSCLIKRLFWHAANPRNVCLELMTVATKSQPKNGALQKNFFHNSLEIIDYHHKQLHHFLIMCIKISPFFYIFMHLVYLEMRE